jgi:hypothetical protein
MNAKGLARTKDTIWGSLSPVQFPRPLFSLRVAGLEYIVGALLVDPTHPLNCLRPGTGAAWGTPRGVPLVESDDERKRQKGKGICPGQGIEP